MRCDVGRRRRSDPWLLWLWCRLAAVALIGPLAWELMQQVSPPPKKKAQPESLQLSLYLGQDAGYSQRGCISDTCEKPLQRDSGGVPVLAQWLVNPTRNHGVAGSIPGLAQWVKELALP